MNLASIEENIKEIWEWVSKRRQLGDWHAEEQKNNLVLQFGRLQGICDRLFLELKEMSQPAPKERMNDGEIGTR